MDYLIFVLGALYAIYLLYVRSMEIRSHVADRLAQLFEEIMKSELSEHKKQALIEGLTAGISSLNEQPSPKESRHDKDIQPNNH